jgi:hypothetical protein
LFQHILKWDFQAERRLRSWANTIAEQRKRVSRQLARNPSLKSRLEEAITDAYGYGRSGASSETDLDIDIFPSGLPYSWEDIMNREFLFVPPTGN